MSQARFPYERWSAWIDRHRRAVLATTAVLCIGATAFSFTRLRLDADVLTMLPAGRPAFDDFKFFVADFGELNELTVLIEGGPLDELKRFGDAFGARLADLDIVRSVHVRTDVEAIREGVLKHRLYNYLPVTAYDRLAERLTRDGIAAQVRADREILSAPFDLEAARAVVSDPLGLVPLAAEPLTGARGSSLATDPGGYVVAPDESALLIFVEPRESAFDIYFSEALLREVRAAEEATRQALSPTAARVRYTGSYVYALEDANMLAGDIGRYTILALIGVLASFFLAYGHLRLLPYFVVPLLVATVVDFAFSILVFDQLNAISMTFAAILYGLSIDSGIHFYTRLLQCPREHGRAAVATTLRALGRAHVGASLTTASAFFLIGFSDLAALRQLGVLTGVGMLLTTVQFFTLYPALGFVLVDRGIPETQPLDSPLLERLGDLVVRHRRLLVAFAVALAIGLAPAAYRVELDASLDRLRPADSDALRIEREIATRFGLQDWSGAILVRRDTLEDALVGSERIARELDELKSTGIVSAFQDITRVLPSETTQRARLQRYERLPRALASEWLRAELAGAGFAVEPFSPFLDAFRAERSDIVRLSDPVLMPFAPLIARQVRARASGYTVATYVQPAPGVSIDVLSERLRDSLHDVDFAFASRALLELELRAMMGRELRFFFIAAIIGNFVLLVINTRSGLEAAGILLPALIALEFLLAGMSICDVALDPVNLVIVALVLGLGVDYGVFATAAERERGGWPRGLRHCGRAVLLTWLTTVVGFGFLAPSRFPALAGLGQLATVGLSLCLVVTMTVVPALLTVLRESTTRIAR